jgi:hypothetical protein
MNVTIMTETGITEKEVDFIQFLQFFNENVNYIQVLNQENVTTIRSLIGI